MLPGSRFSRKELLDDGLTEEENPHHRPEGEIPDIISQDTFDGACLHACSLAKALAIVKAGPWNVSDTEKTWQQY